MSSFIAHSLIGLTVGAQKRPVALKHVVVAYIFFVVLASAPDVDYIINWLRGYNMPLRYTHSVGYVFLVGLGSLFFRNVLFKKSLNHIPTLLFFVAPFSHLILDGLVAVHGNPYLYPFSTSLFTSPIGILPSSGRVDIHNFHFWRNTLIELLIFIPIVVIFVPLFRKRAFKFRTLKVLLGLMFIGEVIIGYNLQR